MEMTKRKKISWFGLMLRKVNSLNGPSWIWFVVLWVVLFCLGMLILGLETRYSDITFEPIFILVLFQLCYVLFLINFLDKQAISTLEGFLPQ
jgi:hypothetical protein